MDVQRYREIIDVSPVRLYKQDLYDLEALLWSIFSAGRNSAEITATVGTLSVSADSVKSLLDLEVGPKTDRLDIWFHSPGEEAETSEGITITFYTNYVQYQLWMADEGRFLVASRKLKDYFRSRRPWYWVMKKTPYTSIVFTSCLILVIVGIPLAFRAWPGPNAGQLVKGVSLSLLGLLGVIGTASKRHFPYTVIHFADRSQRNYQHLSFILAVVALLVSILGSIVFPLFLSK